MKKLSHNKLVKRADKLAIVLGGSVKANNVNSIIIKSHPRLCTTVVVYDTGEVYVELIINGMRFFRMTKWKKIGKTLEKLAEKAELEVYDSISTMQEELAEMQEAATLVDRVRGHIFTMMYGDKG